jgi:hypothetical protein
MPGAEESSVQTAKVEDKKHQPSKAKTQEHDLDRGDAATEEGLEAVMEAMPGGKPPGISAKDVEKALPSQEDQLDSEGNRRMRYNTGALLESEKLEEHAWQVARQLGAEQDPKVRKQIAKEAKARAESTERPSAPDIGVDLPWGWAVTFAREPREIKAKGSSASFVEPGEYRAAKRVNTTLVELDGDSPEQLQDRILHWESIQQPGAPVAAGTP